MLSGAGKRSIGANLPVLCVNAQFAFHLVYETFASDRERFGPACVFRTIVTAISGGT